MRCSCWPRWPRARACCSGTPLAAATFSDTRASRGNERITEHGGYLLYLRQEGRGIGLYDKLDAYELQDRGLDTYDANLALGHGADERDYTSAAQMLHALGASRIALLSNNPDKGAQLARLGITIDRQVPTAVHLTETNAAYLTTKARRGGHDLPGGALAG